MSDTLPSAVTQQATSRGNEFAWSIPAFPEALTRARELGFACLGGQFQFHLDSGIYEPYWLYADSQDRQLDEAWPDYVQRSCSEVLEAFHQRIRLTDFIKLAQESTYFDPSQTNGLDLINTLVFVGYFVNEAEYAALTR